MIDKIIMPSLGATGEDITVVEWLVGEGDLIEAGRRILVVETDKATTEIEAFRGGYIRKVLVKAGEKATIGDDLAIIADSLDEPLDAETGNMETPATEPPAQRQVDSAAPPAPPPASKGGRIQASPLARRLAEERGIDLAAVKASGPIHKADVLAAAISHGGGQRRSALSPMRRAIAARTLQSKTEAPHFYVTARIDMTESLAMQRKLAANAEGAARPTVNDLVILATATALRETPELNASYQNGEVVRYDDVNIGIVIALAGGMIVPVVRKADAMDLGALAATTKRLRDQALKGLLAQSDLTQGTFTISNLGMFGIDSFIGVINPPEAGLLAIGAIQPQPAVVDGCIVVRSLMTATLSADHRLVDGIVAARFLSHLRDLLENPALLLPAAKEIRS